MSHLSLQGNRMLGEAEVTSKIATRESPRFIGLIPEFVYEPEHFNRYVLERDLERVKRYYQSRGFYSARVQAGRVRYEDPDHVAVTIEVVEGRPTTVREIHVSGLDGVAPETRDAVQSALSERFEIGSRFEEEEFEQAERDMQRALTDRGHAYAGVSRSARVDLPGRYAILHFDVKPDRPAVFGEVRLRGLGGLPEAPVRRALDLSPGEEYSTSELENAQQAVLELGVFSSASVSSALDDPPPTPRAVPIDADLERTELRTVRLGGGMQLDTLQTDAHLLAGWENRNFLGGLRRLTLEARPGVVLYPTRVDNLTAPADFLPELGVLAELKQPGFLEARTNGFVRAQYKVYAVINGPGVGDGVQGYREARGTVGIDRSFGRHFFVQPSQNLQTNTPFAYTGTLEADYSSVVISYTELLATVDFRDRVLQPRSGFQLTLPLQLAGLGGDARDLRFKPEGRVYLPLFEGLTLALRTRIGMLLPFNYGPAGSDERRAQLIFFRGFFAGGPTSNRGYSVRDIGPYGPMPAFYVDGEGTCAPDAEGRQCRAPQGGFSSWEASAELRADVSGPLSLAFFCDAADVSSQKLSYPLSSPHLSCGPGVRYDTPVGPIRLDVGVRIPGAQTSGDDLEGDPPEPLGLPLAVAIGIGEAF